jgi:nitrite reductase/ring-hydroxylating ferredoxin subunit
VLSKNFRSQRVLTSALPLSLCLSVATVAGKQQLFKYIKKILDILLILLYRVHDSARDRKELRAMAEFVAVSGAGDLGEGGMRTFDVHGTQITVANVGGAFHAFDDTCTHLQCSLAEGDLEETTVICPCHGSEFDVTTGAVLHGPARKPLATYETRVEGGTLEVEG